MIARFPSSTAPRQPAPPPDASTAYGAPFWLSYLANTCLMVAISLLFRYPDLVAVLGGTEWELGWILGVGMVGSLLMRAAQAVGIDHFGPRRIWLWSVVFFALSCYAHLWIDTIHGPAVYLLRIAYCTSVAGAFGASITYISRRAPVVRVAEVIGTLGTSGFIGMMGGSLLGDLLCGAKVGPQEVHQMFIAATLLGLVSLVFAWLSTRHEPPPQPRRRPPVTRLVRRYNPGILLVVGVAVGIGVGLPGNFLRPYTAELGIGGLAWFFWVYAPTAFAMRLCIRRLPERLGVRPMIFCGLGCLALSMLLYLVVSSAWLLVVPAVFAGIAHAFLFPSVVGGGSTAFPTRFRGLGVTLMLATVDLGNLIGAPIAGQIVDSARAAGIAPYSALFIMMALLLGSVCGFYAVASRGRHTQLGRAPRRLPTANGPVPAPTGRPEAESAAVAKTADETAG